MELKPAICTMGFELMNDDRKVHLKGIPPALNGYARDFQISEIDGKRTLTCKFNVGSGVTCELSGSYVLGSGQAEWQDLTDIEP